MAKRKRPRHTRDAHLEALKHQIQTSGAFRDRPLVFHTNPGPKLSAALEDLVEPFKQAADSTEAYRKLITLAIAAWNAAVLGGPKGQELIDLTVNTIVKSAGEEWRQDALNSIHLLRTRKEQLFPNDKRIIVDYRLTETPQGWNLSVAALIQ